MFKKTSIIGNIVDKANVSARLIKDNRPINFIFLSSKRSHRFYKVYTKNTILVLDLLKIRFLNLIIIRNRSFLQWK